MLRKNRKLDKFYKSLIEKEKIPYKKALVIFEALLKEAVSLGIINSKNILDGLEVDIKVAKALNGLDK